jgi:uncharacterized repeat protein (TIGR01451 family)
MWGQELNYRITVTNNGPDAATDVTLIVTLPNTVLFTSAITGQWICTGPDESRPGGTMACTRATLPSGSSDTILITVSPPNGSGTLTNKVTVSAKQADANTANNTAILNTTLIPAGSGSPEIDPNNGSVGAPGSYFLFTVINFAPNTQLLITINGRTILTFTTNASGAATFVLFFADNAAPGTYTIAVTGNVPLQAIALAETAIAQTQISINRTAPKLTNPGNAPIFKALPTIYLPLVKR